MELNEIHTKHEEASTSFKVILLIFALVLVGVLGYFVYQEQYVSYDNGEVTIKVKKAAATTECGSYTNSTYGFSLTFGTDWKTCKIKSATIDGATATYYVTMPTTSTDSIYTKAGTDHDAGYASLFAMSVYTQTQWAAVIGTETNVPTKAGEAGSYVIAYTPAQAYPEDLQTADLSTQVSGIMATFKTTATTATTED